MSTQSPYIVFADDDGDDQEMLADRFLKSHPAMAFKFFKDGSEVLQYLEDCPVGELPYLLLLDYKMPRLTGVEVLKALHNDHRYDQIHKIVWSTSGNNEYVSQCLLFGAKRYFTKPTNMQELDTIVQQLSQLTPLLT